MASARHLTGAAGRWSATHPWAAIFAWLGCVAILLVTGHLAGTMQVAAEETGAGQTGQAQQMIVRALLLPATMKLLGRYNWYLPQWLQWLPQVSSSPRPPAGRPPRQPVSVL